MSLKGRLLPVNLNKIYHYQWLILTTVDSELNSFSAQQIALPPLYQATLPALFLTALLCLVRSAQQLCLYFKPLQFQFQFQLCFARQVRQIFGRKQLFTVSQH
jgi:hypothetical protein